MAKKTRTELSTSAINTNLPDNTQELITPTTERAQLTDERESVINYKDDLGGASNAGKFLTVATDGESLTMVDEPSGVPDWVTFVTAVNNLMKLTSGGNSGQIQFFDTDGTTLGAQISWVDTSSKLVIYNAQGQGEINLTGGQILLKTGGLTALTIDSGGDATFSGDVNIVNETTTTSQATLAIKGKQTTSGDYPVGEIVFFNNNDSFATIAGVRDGANDKGALLFQTQNGSSGFGTRLTISSGGDATFENNIIGKNTVKIKNDGYRELQFQAANGNLRWSLYSQGGNETGSNAGSNLDLARYNDNGSYLGGVLNISRATGLATFSNGIKFGTGDTLNDYEEGTWTPINGGSSNITVGPTGLDGTYTRIGNRVFVEFRISGITAPYTGAMIYIVLRGFPFAQASNTLMSNGIVTNYPNSRQAGGVINNSGSNNTEWFVYWENTVSNQSNQAILGSLSYITS